MNIALLGYGTVGKGVDKICKNLPDIRVTRILELPNHLTDPRMTSNYEEILADDKVEMVLECMGGIEPAHSFIAAALKAGKPVVTSNKAVVAAHLKEFVELAQTTGVPLLCEAAVGGGVPWLSSIRNARRIDEISAVSGIMNGTTNYLLTSLEAGDASFDEVLAEAQRLGYAEADPSADIDGIDVRNKIIISCLAAFDAFCSAEQVCTTGIRSLKSSDVALFAAHGRRVKLMGRAVRKGQRYAAVVEPVALPQTATEANVPANFNILSLTGTTVGELKFYGQGAGSLPTGNAMVQDILDYMAGERPDFALCEKMSFDVDLLLGDYVLRCGGAATMAAKEGWKAYGADAWLIKDINPVCASEFLAKAREIDPEALIFLRPRKDA